MNIRIKRDVAHIHTGKNVASGVLGLAYRRNSCANKALRTRWLKANGRGISHLRTAVTVHELGHNFSAGHCDQISGCSSQPCRIMCSGVNGMRFDQREAI